MAFRAALLRAVKTSSRLTGHHVWRQMNEGRQAGHLNPYPPQRPLIFFSFASDALAEKSLDNAEVSGSNGAAPSGNDGGNSESAPPLLAEESFDNDKLESEDTGSALAPIAVVGEIGEESNPNSGTSDLSVSGRPRVMPLPEDIAPNELPSEDAKAPQKQRKEKQKKLFGFEQLGSEIAMPTLVPQEFKKRKDHVSLADAIRDIKASVRCAKFDQTVEAHVRLGIDPRRGDQMVRGAATLPHGSGKTVKVAVFAEGAAAEEAKAAGADVVGADNLITEVFASGGKLNFDKCIATPALMQKLGKVARILGPRGLMPNPKVGTVTNNVGEAVKAAKRGRVDFRADKTGIVHAGLGKVSFTEEALKDNIAAFAGALLAAKPVGLKKSSRYAGYFNSFTLSSTMGPGIPVTIQSVALAADNFMKVMEAH